MKRPKPISRTSFRKRIVRVVVPLLVVILAALPTSGAQTRTDECTAECDPRDPDVNGAVPQENGPIRVFLYATPLGDGVEWVLSPVAPHAGNRQTPFQAEDGCGVQFWPHLEHAGGATAFPLVAELILAKAPVAYVYLRNPSADEAPAEVALPVRTAVAIEIVDLETGEVRRQLAGGSSAAFAGAADPGPGTWEVKVPLSGQDAVVPAWSTTDRIGIRVAVRICHDTPIEATPPEGWMLVADQGLRNRIILDVSEPLRPNGIEAQRQGDSVCIRAEIRAPFGTYDVNDSSLTAVIGWDGESNATHGALTVTRRPSDAPDANDPTTATGCVGLPSGALSKELMIAVSARNAQGTYVITQAVILPPTAGMDLPAPSTVIVALAVAGLAAGARLRNRPPGTEGQ